MDCYTCGDDINKGEEKSSQGHTFCSDSCRDDFIDQEAVRRAEQQALEQFERGGIATSGRNPVR